MCVKFGKGLAVAAERTGDCLLVLELGGGFLNRAHVFPDVYLGKGVRLSDGLLKLHGLRLVLKGWFFGITVLRDSARSEFRHSLTAAFVDEKI